MDSQLRALSVGAHSFLFICNSSSQKFCKFSRKDRPAGSQPAFAWDAVSIPIRPHYKVGVRFFQRSLPAFLSAFLAVSFPNIRRERGLNTFHVINRVG